LQYRTAGPKTPIKINKNASRSPGGQANPIANRTSEREGHTMKGPSSERSNDQPKDFQGPASELTTINCDQKEKSG